MVLIGIVLLLIMGQWLVSRRARSIEGQQIPEALSVICPENGLIFFESPGCYACRQMAPLLSQLEAETSVSICRVNIREHQDIAMQLRIMGVPTLMLVQDGRIRDVRLGIVSMKALHVLADKLLSPGVIPR